MGAIDLPGCGRRVLILAVAALLTLPGVAFADASVSDRAVGTAALDLQTAPSVVVRYQRPVPGPVLRGFEPPSSTFGAGHRGVDLDLAPFERVEAAANGVVHHAGPVGATVWVSLAHDDGVITSYGPLTGLEVARGDQVRRGNRLGVLAPGGHGDGNHDRGLHWGARRGLVYIDPLSLLDNGTPRPSLIGAGAWTGTEHQVTPYESWAGNRFGGLALAPSPEASAPGFAVPPSPNHLVVIGGLSSSGRAAPIDHRNLGYASSSVTHLSYAGRRVGADQDPDDPRRDQVPYGPSYTWAGVEPAAQRLAEQLRAQRQREPGRAVDLIGHSMGGLVITYYLANLHDPYDPTLPSIGRVVTVASPHDGSDLASSARFLREHIVLGPAIDLVSGWIPAGGGLSAREVLPLHAPAIDQLAVNSPFVRDYQQAWLEALADGPAGPLAMGTEVLTLAGSADLVVAPMRTELPGHSTPLGAASENPATHRTLPGSHEGVLATEATMETIYRFLAGDEPPDARPGLGAALTDEVAVVVHLGAMALYVTGTAANGVRRLLSNPGAGPIELTDDQLDRSPAEPAWSEP